MSATETVIPLTPAWLQPSEEAEWESFVNEHPSGTIYHSASWKRMLEQAFDHIRGRFLVLRDVSTGRIRVGLPLYAVKSWLLGNRLVSVPFASFCDPLVSSDVEFEQLLPSIREYSEQTSCRRLQLRVRRGGPLQAVPFTAASTYTHHFLLFDKDLDTLFRQFAKSSIRQKIAKSSKAGVVVIEATDNASVKTCHEILAETRRRLRLPPMPFSFFAAMRSQLWPRHMKIFLASHNGIAIGCHLVLTSQDIWISEYSGNRENAVRGVNQLLYWETIKAAHGAGAKRFSFGRTSRANEGLLFHKRRWGVIEEELDYFTIALGKESRKPVSKKEGSYYSAYSAAYDLVRFGSRIVPRFLFDRMGEFCYRHLG